MGQYVYRNSLSSQTGVDVKLAALTCSPGLQCSFGLRCKFTAVVGGATAHVLDWHWQILCKVVVASDREVGWVVFSNEAVDDFVVSGRRTTLSDVGP